MVGCVLFVCVCVYDTVESYDRGRSEAAALDKHAGRAVRGERE